MPDLIHKQWQFAAALILAVYWGFVFMLPFVILEQIASEEPASDLPPETWFVASAIVGYFSYTGVRAWRRKWRARFILRIVVPTALLFSSCVLIGAFAWLG